MSHKSTQPHTHPRGGPSKIAPRGSGVARVNQATGGSGSGVKNANQAFGSNRKHTPRSNPAVGD